MKNKLISVILLIAIIFSSLNTLAASAVSSAQNMANLVVFVRYADDSTNTFAQQDNYTDIDAYFNDTTDLYQSSIGLGVDSSFKNYISTVSRGRVEVNNFFPQDTSSSYNVLTLRYSHEHYTDDSYIISEVMDAFENNTLALPDDKLDNVEEDVLDCLMIITQGDSGNFPDDEVLYPHKGVFGGSTRVKNQYYVRNYVMIDSDSLLNGQRQGVVTHEFMHVIGYPDLYRYSGSGDPVRIWDLMASTSPYMQYPLSYMRSLFGWVPLGEITHSGTYTLNAVTSETGNVVYKIKTPISDSEFFALEYRVQNTDTVAGIGFETKVYSGLLAYRINNGVAERANSMGNDYVYVFRPGETSLTASGGSILDAAINPDIGETSYGSADFDAPFTDNTIFYSTGQNSGITLSNITTSPDKSSITFDIDFPDYGSLDLWDKEGASFGNALVGDTDMAVADNGDIYTTTLSYGDFDSSAQVWKCSGGVWSRLGSAFGGAYDCRVKTLGNDVYVYYCNSSGKPVVAKYSGSAWVTVATISGADYPNSGDLFTDGEDMYVSFIKDGTTLVIKKVLSNGVEDVDSSLTSGSNSFANITTAVFGGKIYAVYSYFGWGLTEKRTIVSAYDLVSGAWTQAQTLSVESANTHRAVVRDGKLWILSGATNVNPVLASFDGTAWAQETVALPTISYSGLSLDVVDGEPYIVTLCGSSLKLLKMVDGAWQNISEITPDCAGFDFTALGGTVYALNISEANGNGTIYTRELSAAQVKLSVSAPSSTVRVGSVVQLTAVFDPASAASALTWSSSQPLSASVNQSGAVTALRAGSRVVITATDAAGNTASCTITVVPNNASIRIYCLDGKLEKQINWWHKYSSATLSLRHQPQGCEGAVSYNWSSDNSKVLVDSKGNITNTGSFARKARITVTALDSQGNVVAKSSVTVKFYKFNWQREKLQTQAFVGGSPDAPETQAVALDYLFSFISFILGKAALPVKF